MFFYKRVIKEKDKEDVIVEDCINPISVVRGVWFEDKLVLLLNDGHEASEYVERPQYNKAGKLIREPQKARVWKVSEIELDKEDSQRYKLLYEHK